MKKPTKLQGTLCGGLNADGAKISFRIPGMGQKYAACMRLECVGLWTKGSQRKRKGCKMTTWVCRDCGCDVSGYGVCRCFDDETECFCAECAWENHGIRLIFGSAAKPAMNNELDQIKQRVTELKEMLKQSMQNNDNLRNDNYQLLARVTELKGSNAELLDVLEDFVRDVDAYVADDMQPEDAVAYFIGEYRRAKRLIKKGIQ